MTCRRVLSGTQTTDRKKLFLDQCFSKTLETSFFLFILCETDRVGISLTTRLSRFLTLPKT